MKGIIEDYGEFICIVLFALPICTYFFGLADKVAQMF